MSEAIEVLATPFLMFGTVAWIYLRLVGPAFIVLLPIVYMAYWLGAFDD